jgi:DNA-binding CsgD family transcriptional regulator/tetratricopeptide (TPR) repeat protein
LWWCSADAGFAGILGGVTSRIVSPVFAGREAELAVLAGVFDDVAGGVPGTVLVGAEAGGGKSRLVGEFAARVAGRARVLAGGCVELSATGLPYAPFTAALRQLVRERGAAEVAALLPGDAVGELAALLPDFGTPAVGTDPETARGRLFEMLLTLLEAVAAPLPLVLVVEDVHWADRSARDLLSFLVGNLRHCAVLLVVTFRSDVLHRTHPLRALLAALGRLERVTRMELPRLSRGQVEEQLEGILGRPPEAAVTGAVYARGGGVPLFTEALVNADGTVSPGLPGSLRDLLLGAVKELPEQAQQVLRAAATGGARVGHELLATVTGLDDASLAAVLRPAVAANVMVADADGYAFRHELIREAVREDLLPGERVQAERAFAEALEANPALSPERLVSVQLALHWRGAQEHERALRAAWAAAAEAAAGFAFEVQLQMLEQVLELWDRVPGAAAHTGADRAGVIELAADAARWAGEPARGLTLVEAALGELGEEREADRIASLLLLRAELRRQGLLPGQVDDLRAALDLAGAPTRVRAQILGQLSMALMLQNRDAEAKPPAEEMRALAERLGDQECQTEAVITLAQLGHREGLDTITALQSARETARQIGSARLELRAYAQITHGLEGRGEHERAIQASGEGLARAKQLGLARYVAAPLAENLAESLTSAGRWDEALEVMEEALGLDPAPFGRAFLLVLRGQIAVARGEQETAARIVQQLSSQPSGSQAESQIALPIARLTMEFLLAQGDLAGALAAARTIPARHLDAEPRYLWPLLATGMRTCADVGAACLTDEAGDPAELRRALEREAASIPRPGPVERAHAAVFAAEASRAAGHLDLAAWDAAAAAWEGLGQPYLLADALLRAAGAAAAAGNRGTAAARLQQAAELAGQLRAGPLLQQISQLARRARIEVTGGSRAAAAPFGLTGRELEVLRLVAAGRGNREIAAVLFISPKTASVHVSNILGKLGVASRGEPPATAHRLHIFDA